MTDSDNTNFGKRLFSVAAALAAGLWILGAVVAAGGASRAAAAAPAADGKAKTEPAAKTPGQESDLSSDITRFDGKPYKVYPDGKVDFATYRGFNLFGNMCGHCHGLAARGSSFAPSLVNTLKSMSYGQFVATVFNGRVNITSSTTNVMPSFGENPTVVKYIDSIYAYLKGRSDGAIPATILNWEGPKNE